MLRTVFTVVNHSVFTVPIVMVYVEIFVNDCIDFFGRHLLEIFLSVNVYHMTQQRTFRTAVGPLRFQEISAVNSECD